MKFIHIADVHLGMIPDAGQPWGVERAEEIWETFRNVIQVCNKEQVDLLLIAGDLFHGQPQRKDLKEADYLFSTLAHTKVVLIAGNHDYVQRGSAYMNFQWNERVTFLAGENLQTVEFPELETSVTGFSYHSRKADGAVLAGIRPPRRARYEILLAHGGEGSCCPMDYAQLGMAGFDYVALGHIHKPNIWDGYSMAYSGSLEPTDCNDKGERGYIRGTITASGTSYSLVPFSARQYIHIRGTVRPGNTAGSISDRLNKAIAYYGLKNLYVITLTGYYDPACPLDVKELRLDGNIVKLTDETAPDYDLEALQREHMDDVIGMFIASLHTEPADPIRRKAIYYGLQALLEQ